MNLFNIERAFKNRAAKGNPKVFILIDLHHTVIEGKYNRFNEGASIYPGALEVLQQWTKRPDICLILWTSSHWDAIAKVRERLAEQDVWFNYVNSNPEVPNDDLCDFEHKPYFDILIDDKGGAEGSTDWHLIKAELIRIGEWRDIA